MSSNLELLEEFKNAGALLEGHFVLSSGLHSAKYLQCARVLMDANRAERLCGKLAKRITEKISEQIDLVISPAMGGVIVGYEMGRQLNVPAIFYERVDGSFTLRRGFNIHPGAKCLMVEDVVSTGLSSRECIKAISHDGGNVIAGCSLIDRSNGTADIGVPYISLIQLDIPAYKVNELPPELENIPIEKPGSRLLR